VRHVEGDLERQLHEAAVLAFRHPRERSSTASKQSAVILTTTSRVIIARVMGDLLPRLVEPVSV
jgi:hypothetical protein